MKSGAWAKVSQPAKELVRKMLPRDPARRYTAEQVSMCAVHHLGVRSKMLHRDPARRYTAEQYKLQLRKHRPEKGGKE